MTRGRLSLLALVVVVAAAVALVRIARSPASEPPAAAQAGGEATSEPQAVGGPPSHLVLLVLDTRAGPFAAVVGGVGSRPPGALVLPNGIDLTIPGQGDATVEEAARLPGTQGATAVANLLGVWIPHSVTVGSDRFAALVDRAGGIEVDGADLSGAEAVDRLLAARGDRDEAWRDTLRALLAVATWDTSRLPQADAPDEVADLLNAARGAFVEVLPADPSALGPAVSSAFGIPDRGSVPVIVLNGSGTPGIGEQVAERLIPSGFRIVVSENASSFDHETTLIVVSSEDERPIGERVRDLLGVGEVQVAGSASDLATVTVVVGKDFGA
jgi:LytR cell envelope-related transcriptional attenuator